jgi:hypothetical protein
MDCANSFFQFTSLEPLLATRRGSAGAGRRINWSRPSEEDASPPGFRVYSPCDNDEFCSH